MTAVVSTIVDKYRNFVLSSVFGAVSICGGVGMAWSDILLTHNRTLRLRCRNVLCDERYSLTFVSIFCAHGLSVSGLAGAIRGRRPEDEEPDFRTGRVHWPRDVLQQEPEGFASFHDASRLAYVKKVRTVKPVSEASA